MVISNEPGLYVAGHFGIRHENLVLVREGEKNDYGQFMYLEPLTMVPFDREAIDINLMSAEEKVLLNDYHAKVYETLSPYFSGERIGRKTPIKKEQPLIRMEEIFKGVNFKESCIG